MYLYLNIEINYEITEICYKQFGNVASNSTLNCTLLNSQNHVLGYSDTALNRIPKKVKRAKSYSADSNLAMLTEIYYYQTTFLFLRIVHKYLYG